jgi:hypothetical protein
MRRLGMVLSFCLASVAFVSTANANENSIDCVEIKLVTLSQSEAGQKQLQSTSPLALGEQCGKENNWTQRKAISAAFYTGSKMQLRKVEENWSTTGYPKDLPLRIYKRITIRELIELTSTGKSPAFTKVFDQELGVTGSKLNVDGRIDKLSLAESEGLGLKLGGYLGALLFQDEFQRYFEDPAYQSPEFIELFSIIVPDSREFWERLK